MDAPFPYELHVLYASYPLLEATREFLKAHPFARDTEEAVPRKAHDLAKTCAEIVQSSHRRVDVRKADLLRCSFVCLVLAVHDVTDMVSPPVDQSNPSQKQGMTTTKE